MIKEGLLSLQGKKCVHDGLNTGGLSEFTKIFQRNKAGD